jgi:2-iminoacetate synthase ThiH
MEKAIREAGREPMQRNTFYERIVSTGSRKQVSEAVPA